MKKIQTVFKKIYFESQISAFFDYSLLQCLSTKYNNFLQKFFGHKTATFCIPFMEIWQPKLQYSPFFTFQILLDQRSSLQCRIHRGVVTHGPIGPSKMLPFMKHRKKSTPCGSFKVQLFWEGHKNLQDLPHSFDIYSVNVKSLRHLLNKHQNHKADCANFCGLPRKAELYNWPLNSIYIPTSLPDNVLIPEL